MADALLVLGLENIARCFGVAPKTIVEWQHQGMPVALRGGSHKPSQYNLSACVAWKIAHELGKNGEEESARERLFRLQGDKIATALAKERGQLVHIDDVEPKWRAACVAAREQLLNDRRGLLDRLDAEPDRAKRDEILDESNKAFLRKLADWRQVDEGDDEPAPDDESDEDLDESEFG